ncbi:hypothetical protein [Oryzobacter telluris]|uniref:hypothetical protein n=1 Tax=Oryzobacter telluris TaxID=3149179 RepID=UPI00370CFE4C
MVWIVLGVVALVVLVVLYRDLTRRPDPTALPEGARVADGENVAWDRSWDGVRPQGINYQGPGPL